MIHKLERVWETFVNLLGHAKIGFGVFKNPAYMWISPEG